jgi:Raf kinase inhibitor-like YbhB/YbcL family protein
MNSIIPSMLLGAGLTGAPVFQLSSPDVHEGKSLATEQLFNGFGCSGGNLSPKLEWQHLPAGTKSIAVTVFDPDAPTGSGFWHWLIYDIPVSVDGLPKGIGSKAEVPAGAQVGRNDFGTRGFDGACPPPGDKPHRYVFTVYALKVEHLGVAQDASAAMISLMLNMNSLGKATLTATASR